MGLNYSKPSCPTEQYIHWIRAGIKVYTLSFRGKAKVDEPQEISYACNSEIETSHVFKAFIVKNVSSAQL